MLKAYRSTGGWVMGSYWEAGRVGKLHPKQAAVFLSAGILVPADAAPAAAAPAPVNVQPTPMADKPAPSPAVTHEPPEHVRRRNRRVTVSTDVGQIARIGPVASSTKLQGS
ncbi:MAG: hypothetical protein ACM31O_01635 [Bacteroidota bacterium]